MVICGGGGLGKTSLVTEYIHSKKYPKRIWINAGENLALHQMKTYINTLDPKTENLKTTEEIVQFFY